MSAAESVIVPELLRSETDTGLAGITALDDRRARLPTGTSVLIREVISLIRQVSGHDSTVLVLGESGTGKEVCARAIHDLSPRRNRPFVAVNCGAIPADLLESELFGHERGAFTGAVSARKGRFEIAEGGTLFLDEIGDMSPTMQVKLLRVLQERMFERVGNHVPMRCNVRIIAATHRNLEEAIARGTFRSEHAGEAAARSAGAHVRAGGQSRADALQCTHHRCHPPQSRRGDRARHVPI